MERNVLRISALYHLSISWFEPGAAGKDPETGKYEVIWCTHKYFMLKRAYLN